MPRSHALVLLAIAVVLTACGRKEAKPPPGFTDEGVAAQKRVSQSPQDAVVTAGKLRACWVDLKIDGGAVALDNEQVARLFGTGGTGGVIPIAGCSDCQLRGEPPYGDKCVAKKSGSQTGCGEVATTVCATTPKACLRGLFGGSRGVIMY